MNKGKIQEIFSLEEPEGSYRNQITAVSSTGLIAVYSVDNLGADSLIITDFDNKVHDVIPFAEKTEIIDCMFSMNGDKILIEAYGIIFVYSLQLEKYIFSEYIPRYSIRDEIGFGNIDGTKLLFFSSSRDTTFTILDINTHKRTPYKVMTAKRGDKNTLPKPIDHENVVFWYAGYLKFNLIDKREEVLLKYKYGCCATGSDRSSFTTPDEDLFCSPDGMYVIFSNYRFDKGPKLNKIMAYSLEKGKKYSFGKIPTRFYHKIFIGKKYEY